MFANAKIAGQLCNKQSNKQKSYRAHSKHQNWNSGMNEQRNSEKETEASGCMHAHLVDKLPEVPLPQIVHHVLKIEKRQWDNFNTPFFLHNLDLCGCFPAILYQHHSSKCCLLVKFGLVRLVSSSPVKCWCSSYAKIVELRTPTPHTLQAAVNWTMGSDLPSSPTHWHWGAEQ